MNKYQLIGFINILTISFLISYNIFFLIFVHDKYDLSPNFALAFISLIFCLGQLYSFNKMKQEYFKNRKAPEEKG